MTQAITVHYPNPTDFENAILFISVCKMGNYVTAGRSDVLEMPITYEEAKDLSAQFGQFKVSEDAFINLEIKILTIKEN